MIGVSGYQGRRRRSYHGIVGSQRPKKKTSTTTWSSSSSSSSSWVSLLVLLSVGLLVGVRSFVVDVVVPSRAHRRVVASAPSSGLDADARRRRRSRLPPLFAKEKKTTAKKKTTKTTTRWIASSSTKETTRAVRAYVRPGDRVAELGSALRETSHAVCEAVGPTGYARLVDVGRKHPRYEDAKRTTAMRRAGDETGFFEDRADFVETERFRRWRGALFFHPEKDHHHHHGHEKEEKEEQEEQPTGDRGYDVLVLDVTSTVGNDLDLTAVSLVREFLELNDSLPGDRVRMCRTVIVKSASLNAWARRLVHGQYLPEGKLVPPAKLPGGDNNNNNNVDGREAPPPPLVVGTVGVKEYRRTVPHVVESGDVVLEIGCHSGNTTVALHRAATEDSLGGGAVGVDIGPRIVELARKRHGREAGGPTAGLFFEVADGRRTGTLSRLRRELFPEAERFDAVYLDVGGLSGDDGLLEALSLLTALGNALEPRCLVVKSACVSRLARELSSFSEIWHNKEDL